MVDVTATPLIGSQREQVDSGMEKKKILKLFLFLLVFQVLVYLLYVIELPIFSFSEQVKLPSQRSNKWKTILIWNYPDRIESSAIGFGHEPFVTNQCEVSDCVLYESRSSLPLDEYDAVLVNMHKLGWLSWMPSFKRKEHQRFVFFTQESPKWISADTESMANIFNWTMSYRLNSDIQLLYGRILPGPTAPQTPEEARQLIVETHSSSFRNYAANKTGVVAWMVSHCYTDGLRETYVDQLKKFIPVDIYGRCGDFSCPRDDHAGVSVPGCYSMIEKTYKFYLSFENAFCTDYVTEKFFQIASRDVIPIVYGGADYSQFAPPHSYINALDYTPDALAAYLKILDSNDTLYNEYFWWKRHYRVEAGVKQMVARGFCDLCKKLHQDEGIVKYYPELVSEWHPNKACFTLPSWDKTIPSTFSWILHIIKKMIDSI